MEFLFTLCIKSDSLKFHIILQLKQCKSSQNTKISVAIHHTNSYNFQRILNTNTYLNYSDPICNK